MASIPKVLEFLYPGATALDHWRVQDMGDGTTAIVYWDESLGPQPSLSSLEATEASQEYQDWLVTETEARRRVKEIMLDPDVRGMVIRYCLVFAYDYCRALHDAAKNGANLPNVPTLAQAMNSLNQHRTDPDSPYRDFLDDGTL